MEEGSNTGAKNFHGAPLSSADAAQALTSLQLPDFSTLTKAFSPVRERHRAAFVAAKARRLPAVLPFSLPSGYRRTLTTTSGAARKDFGAVHLKALMAHDPRIVVLHADLADSGGFGAVEKAFPGRVINVGVAEANMAMMAAGMRQAGLLPVTYTFAAFGTNEARANVRLIDINTGHIPLGVLHDCTHAGLSVGEDGETHQERNYTNLPFDHTHVWVAGDSNQAAAMAERGMEIIAQGTANVYVFSGRSNHEQFLRPDGTPSYAADYVFDERATLLRGHGDQRDEATILSYGSALHEAVRAADLLKEQHQRSIRVLNVACLRPLDASAVLQAALETQHLLVAEDHNTEGGLASQVADLVADLALPCTVRRIGVRRYFPSGPSQDLMVIAGLDHQSIADVVLDQFSRRLAGGEDVFVSCLYGLSERLPHTRFVVTAAPFIDRMRTDISYLRSLRELWKSRAISSKQLPKNEDLQAMLPPSIPMLNPLTGDPREAQHDIGIVP